ncbi:NAD(P)-dependent oxidoreductase [Bradyrhizobium sp. AUGA SZCCT0222]|uniref:NAD(P)-dependent oxidoreductase n=1 Tax=Bradyrhizobium sp. AUGA SZCCT0222 TaxID=2807668 RepID=UPI001BA73EB8|nr:NAD(P)-dependent oxidoreductase [Bradyrhizobium sp. AUGA SZCCT0222]MBR1270364.1 NAD(P)-dependent oxidoreductase [Bradyrhizobium sp. AUGA SZCCT0222]
MTNPRLGFAGVGKMGGLMAARLIEGGHPLIVFDANDRAVAPLVKAGAMRANALADLAAQAEIVFASLPTPDVVREVALGPGGIVESATTKLFVDLSTTGPRIARIVAEGLASKGITAVDCPVSGGLAGARNGTLALMVSCPAIAYEQLQDLLTVFGKPIFVSEIPGAAQTMKLANNLLAACAIAISSEAFVFGVKGGLDPKIMCEVFNASSGRNTATLDKFPRSVLPGTFDFGFSTALAFKDVKLCLDEAEALGVPTPVGSAIRHVLGITQAMFGPESDFTSMVRPFERWAGVEVRSPPMVLNEAEQ